MKTRIIIGGKEEVEVTVKTYPSGIKIVETGDTVTTVKGETPESEKKVKVKVEHKDELFAKPDKFKFSKGRLVRKGKK